jgi:hypothetical protein
VRRLRTASLLVRRCCSCRFLWLQDDHDETRAMLEAVIAEYEASPALPLHLNSRVERWINEFRTTRRHEFQRPARSERGVRAADSS